MTPTQIEALITRGALFVINHSGGKDSQAMTSYLRRTVPADQLIVIHAHLPEVEWSGTALHVQNNIGALPYIEVAAKKTFFDMVEHRGMWPSPAYRQCTSDLKRGPIEVAIRGYLKCHPEFGGLIVNCMGLRAEESPARSNQVAFRFNKRNSKAGREWYDWLPIHNWLVDRVFTEIAQSGQVPHWAYSRGMSRLSCCFCIMSNKADLITAARHNPSLYARVVETEKRMGHTLQTKNGEPVGLEAVTGIAANPLPLAA